MITDAQEESNSFHYFVLSLFLINIISENIASFSQQLNSFIGSIAFLILLFLTPTSSERRLNIQNFFILCICFSAFPLLFKLERFHRLLLFSISLLLLSQLQISSGKRKFDLYILFVSSILYTAIIFSYENFSVAWYVVQGCSKAISKSVSVILPYTINYSAAYTGALIAASFFAHFISYIFITRKWKPLEVFYFLFLMLFFQLGYVALHSYFLMFPIFYSSLEGRVAVDLNIILFLFFLIPLFIFNKKFSMTWKTDILISKWFILCFFLIMTTIITKSFFNQKEFYINPDKRILFFNEGVVDWDIPRFGLYGGERGGMFGALIKYLKLHRFDVVISNIDHDNLEKAKVLVLINLNRKLSEKEIIKILNFVKRGGSLLIIGDHTGKDIIREPFNELLSPVGIQFKFDSAISHIPKWSNSFEMMPHFINNHLRDENDLQIWIGASLGLKYPASPVILGKRAFSDSGNYLSPQTGYLGDMKYKHGERLGDIVLVAESTYGNGNVLVFGDSSPFQNSAISLSYLFVERVFIYLSDKNVKDEQQIDFFGNFLLLLAAFILAIRSNRIFILVSLVLIMCALALFATNHFKKNDYKKHFPPNESFALVDASHLQRFSLDLWGEPDGFGGLLYNLFRNGYFPIVMRDFKPNWIKRVKLLIIISPVKKYLNSEIDSLKAFVKNGGNLLISTGILEAKSMEALLNEFKISVENMPFGRIDPSQNSKGLYFYNAWPVFFDKDFSISVCTAWDKSVIVYSKYQKGGILFFGDSEFFLNKNLESMYDHVIPNILAFKDYFDHYLKN